MPLLRDNQYYLRQMSVVLMLYRSVCILYYTMYWPTIWRFLPAIKYGVCLQVIHLMYRGKLFEIATIKKNGQNADVTIRLMLYIFHFQ